MLYISNGKLSSGKVKKTKDFQFKKFTISQEGATHKVGTDGVLLGAWVNVNNCKSILEIGTGSGVIALMLAQRGGEGVKIEALEIQHEDAVQAKKNVANSRWCNQIKVHEIAAQKFSPGVDYDLIVSNPPFFTNSMLPPGDKRIKVRHTESLSFDDLLATARRFLKVDGRFAVILPTAESRLFKDIAFTKYQLFCIRQCEFRTRVDKPVERLLMEFSRDGKPTVKEELLLYNEDNEWSEQYQKLTADFYLKF
jgi:tRNA1Val (adenine37-N6)-methyltransferase